jgi:hypothetical protein
MTPISITPEKKYIPMEGNLMARLMYLVNFQGRVNRFSSHIVGTITVGTSRYRLKHQEQAVVVMILHTELRKPL